MTDKEVMQQALEALECTVEQGGGPKCEHEASVCFCKENNAITALKAALEQPEQEPVEYQMRLRPTWEVTSWSDWKKCSRESAGDYAKTPRLHDWEYEVRALYTTPPPAAQPEQEPVAYLVYAKGSHRYSTLTFDVDKVPEIYKGGEAVPLYTTPPAAQRPWVGLTDDEISTIAFDTRYVGLVGTTRAIEAKLKERNT